MNTTFYFIRHAESEANRKRLLGSRLPFPLTEEGKKDAEKIAHQLSEQVSLDRIITSPLVRARQTAAAFEAAYGIEAEEDPRITEQELGEYAGLSYDEVKKNPDYQQDATNRWDWTPPGGESYRDISLRVLDFFRSLEGSSGKILIVTHAVTFRLIRAILEDSLPCYPEGFPNNGEIWKVDFKGLGQRHTIESLFLGDSRRFVHNP